MGNEYWNTLPKREDALVGSGALESLEDHDVINTRDGNIDQDGG